MKEFILTFIKGGNVTKYILFAILSLSSAAYALPETCDTNLTFHQIFGNTREVVISIPAEVRIHTYGNSKNFLTTTTLNFRIKGYVPLATKPVRDGVEVTYVNHWGSSEYPGYLDATTPAKGVISFKVINPLNPEFVVAGTAKFAGNVVSITDYIHTAVDSTTYLIRPSSTCITRKNTLVIK